MTVALVDCNNFYCSCERLFRPSLIGRPVVVLSANDGNAISRSNEAKSLGISMGAPWHEIKHLVDEAGLVALSSNFALYGDISARVMTVLSEFSPAQEIYSIDESFLDFTGLPGSSVERGRQIRERVLQWVGIPTCVGIAETKTLAKFANFVAKTAERKPGTYPPELAQVCDLSALPAPARTALFEQTEVGEVWGIGPRIAARLQHAGVKTIAELLRIDLGTVRREFSVVLERTVRELQGSPCLGLDEAPEPRQQIMCSRSFGRTVSRLDLLRKAIGEFVTRAAEKLRAQQCVAGEIGVFIHTSPFRRTDKQYGGSVVVPLPHPTADTRRLLHAAEAGLQSIYRDGFNFAKGGIVLLDLRPEDAFVQGELALDEGARDKSKLMSTVDAVNRRFGRGTVVAASLGVGEQAPAWHSRAERRTPHYTTQWRDIPLVRAGLPAAARRSDAEDG